MFGSLLEPQSKYANIPALMLMSELFFPGKLENAVDCLKETGLKWE